VILSLRQKLLFWGRNLLLWQSHIFLAKNIGLLLSEQFQTPIYMNIEITIVRTICDFGQNFFNKQPFSLAIFYQDFGHISCEKNLVTLAYRQRLNGSAYSKCTDPSESVS